MLSNIFIKQNDVFYAWNTWNWLELIVHSLRRSNQANVSAVKLLFDKKSWVDRKCVDFNYNAHSRSFMNIKV